MATENRKVVETHEKRGIILTSKSPIDLQYIKLPLPENKFILTYAAISNSPISIIFDNENLIASTLAERNTSESDGSDGDLPMHPSKRQKRQEERDLKCFWQNETSLLPDILTRIPKSENARLLQHSMLLECSYLGRSYLAATRAEVDKATWELEAKEKEVNDLKAKVLELQMRNDIVERKLKYSSSDSEGKKGAVTKTQKTHQSRKSFPKNILVAPDANPDESFISHMGNESVMVEDPAIKHVKRRPMPLMGIKTTCPPNSPTSPTPRFYLEGTGDFSLQTRGGRGGYQNRGNRQPNRGQVHSRHDDAIAGSMWQTRTFFNDASKGQTVKKETSPPKSKSPPSTTVTITRTTSITSAGPSTPAPSTPKASTAPKPNEKASELARKTRSKVRYEKFKSDKDQPKSEDEDDGSQLRCDTSSKDEAFFNTRESDFYDAD